MLEKTRVYHATDHWFQEINFTKTSAWTPKTNGEGPGLYFHLDKQSAVSYARSRLKYVYTVELFAAELEDFTETENVDAYIRRIASVLECETGVDVLPVLENNLRDVHPAIKDWDMSSDASADRTDNSKSSASPSKSRSWRFRTWTA